MPSAAYPRSGGIYVFLREAFGPLWAFLFGWAELLMIRPAAYGAISITSAAYTLRSLGVDPAAPAGTLPVREDRRLDYRAGRRLEVAAIGDSVASRCI